jgi:hypothetical protein
MVAAVTGKPPQGLDQLRSQFYAAGIDLKTALKNFALAADNIKKATGGPCVENITAFILYFFKTAFPALLAAAVPISIFGSQISRHLFFPSLNLGPEHIRQCAHSFRPIILLTTKFSHCGLFLCGSASRTGKSK